MNQPTTSLEPVLQIKNLSKHFGGVKAVSNVSFNVQQHETLAIIGPNGAGKTTLYNMLSGRMQPTHGQAVFEGRVISGLPPHKISRLGVSRSFQINNIFNEMTVQENVEVAVTALLRNSYKWFNRANKNIKVKKQALELLDQLSIADLADQRAGTISYGDKRLLEIAVVLATKPRLVLLDEPTAGMTPDETGRVINLVKGLAATGLYTFLITEHDMHVVFELADRILVMQRGQTLVAGLPQEIKHDPRVRKAYLGEDGGNTE